VTLTGITGSRYNRRYRIIDSKLVENRNGSISSNYLPQLDWTSTQLKDYKGDEGAKWS